MMPRGSASEAPSPARSRGDRLLAPGLAAFGVLLRLGLPVGLDEALPMKRAFAMWGWEAGRLTLDPGTAGWPSLSFYLHLLLQHLQYGLGRVTGAYADRDDYFVAAWPDLAPIVPVARAVSLAAAGGVIWVGARLAQRLAGRPGAVLTGLLLALSPLLVEYSGLITPDILVALFSALAIGRIVAIQERGRWSDYVWAGVWIGLGISSKYTPVLLLPAVVAAHLLAASRPGSGRSPWLDPRPWLTALAALLAFAATSPYLWLDLRTLARDVTVQSVHMTRAHFGQEAQGLSFYPIVLGQGLGWTGLAAGLAGLTWASLRSRGPWLALAACVLPYYLGLSALSTEFPRYMLPLLMPLAVGASGLLHEARRIRWPGGAAARMWLTALVVTVALAPGALRAVRDRAAEPQPSTHEQAERFLREASLRGTLHVAAESWTVPRSPAQRADDLDPAFVRRLSPAQRSRLSGRRSYRVEFIPMTAVEPEQTALYYDLRHYTVYDLIAVSQAVRGRYLADPDRFPAHVRFYADLDRYATLAWRSGPEQDARGAEIRMYRLSPDSALALIRDRGPLDVARLVGTAGPLHGPTLTRFVDGVARAALARREWPVAERYYSLLLDEGASAGLGPEDRAELARVLAELRSRPDSTAALIPRR